MQTFPANKATVTLTKNLNICNYYWYPWSFR